MQELNNKTSSSNAIEYLGINISGSQVTNRKLYYIWDNRDFPIDSQLKKFLTPFDFGIRGHGVDFSIGSFVSEVTYPRVQECIRLIRNKYEIDINDDVLREFYQFQQIPKEIHYDPIISFKYKDGVIVGASLYVTALKDKSLVKDYMEQTISLLLPPKSSTTHFIRHVVTSRYADMFQIAWDFNHCGLTQRKVYLKVKQHNAFISEMEKVFPELTTAVYQDGFRFCELAFVIKDKELKSFNLYFKPL